MDRSIGRDGSALKTAMLRRGILITVLVLAGWCGGGCNGKRKSGEVDGSVADGGVDAAAADAEVNDADGPDAENLAVWPNAFSKANSDPWLAQHHDEIEQMRPRILALNFVNGRTIAEMTAHMEQAIAAIAESSRYHGDIDGQAPVFLQYELAYTVDLTDHPPPQDWPYNNSTLYPREDPVEGYWGLDYEQLFTQQYADYYGIEDPDQPGRNLTLCELIERGLVHEVWIYGDGDVPDVNGAEILEFKPFYDENFQQGAGDLNRCAGNGCFDSEDEIPSDCTRTVRIAWMNNTRGVGCFLESLSHGFESIAANNPLQIPYLSRYFVPFAGFDMDTRYGVPFDSFYSCAFGPQCLDYPSETQVAWDIGGQTGAIDPWDPVCGNVHFTPNSRGHYDLTSPHTVLTSCRTYRTPDETTAPFESTVYAPYQNVAPDCMGPFLVWWRQQWPGLENDALDDDGLPMRNWWVFIYY
jgi:hypothetical protein